MTIIKAISAFVVGAVVVGLVGYYGGIFSNNVQASYQGRVVTSQVQQRVRTADFAQATYEQFFNDCNAVVADKAKIAQAQERVREMKLLPEDIFGTKGSKVADAVSDLTGLQQSQADTAARYNAAAAEYTRSQFLAQSLPARLVPPYQVTC